MRVRSDKSVCQGQGHTVSQGSWLCLWWVMLHHSPRACSALRSCLGTRVPRVTSLCCRPVSGLTCPSGRCDSSWEFGICAALAVTKVCSSLLKALLPPFHPRLADPNSEQPTRASPQLYFTSRAAAHGRENADLRKIPGALSLRPIFPRLFLISEAGGVAGVDHAGPVPVFISMEAAHRLARSLLPTPPGLGSAGGEPSSPRSAGFNYPYPYLHSCSYGGY